MLLIHLKIVEININSCSSTSGASTISQKSFLQFYSLFLFNNRARFFNKEALKQLMHQEIKNATMNGIILTKI